MEIWNEIKKTYSAAADKTAEVAGTITETAKIKYQITSLKTQKKISFRKLGELLYDSHAKHNEHTEEINAIFSEIDETNEKIATNTKQLLELKNEIVCPACATVMDKEDMFCSKCGEKLATEITEDNEEIDVDMDDLKDND